MIPARSPHRPLRVASAALLLAAGIALAERLPVRTYTVADGLVVNRVHRIVQDRRGFLWLGTIEGLSRFDGREFRNFTQRDGLPSQYITTITESADGAIWIGTDAGFCRLRETPQNGSYCDRFLPGAGESAAVINDVAVAVDGTLWVATNDGLFRITGAENGVASARSEPIDLGAVFLPGRPHVVISLHLDADGTLWCGTWGVVFQLDRQARLVSKAQTPFSSDSINRIEEDLHGTIWLATRVGVARLVRDENKQNDWRLEFVRAAPNPDRELPFWTNQIVRDRHGRLWAVGDGLVEIDPERHGPDAVHHYGADSGLCGGTMEAVFEDRESNLWVGSSTCGLLKLERTGLVAMGESDGLPARSYGALIEDRGGAICALARIDKWYCAAEDRFTAIAPRGLAKIPYIGWSWNQPAVQDRTGSWWLAAGSGLVRYPPLADPEQLATTAPLTDYHDEPLVWSHDLFRLFSDSRDDLWVGFATGAQRLLRWDRASATFRVLASPSGERLQQPSCFAEDERGRVWIGFRGGDLFRAEHDRLEPIALWGGLPGAAIESLLFDHAGRLWVATGHGLWRIDDPSAAALHPHRYDRETGLASELVNALVEGPDLQIYVGTISGLDVLEPESGRIRHLGVADGLANDWIVNSLRDRKGRLWFGTLGGVSRYTPEPRAPSPPPSILVTGLDLNGVRQPISVLGQSEVAGLTLGPGETTLRIDVSGLSFAAGGKLRFEHRFDGEEWSAPSDQASVTLARISPGSYRVQLRAVRPDGVTSATPASVSFLVRPPFWRTWWFVSALGLLLMAVGAALYRARSRQLVAVERMRTRIAMDLHDDVGSTLSQIALQSELTLSRLERGEGADARALEQISAHARGAVEAMSDVVWSVEPSHDLLSDLVRRIRAFALDAMESSAIEIALALPSEDQETPLTALLRRQVYLVFKECLNNALKHAGATRIEVALTIGAGLLTLSVRDDGAGFELDGGTEVAESGLGGHGLHSMRERAVACGGSLSIESAPGKGTVVTLRTPLEVSRKRGLQ